MKPYFQADRRRRHDLRRGILDAILLSLKTGCQWRMLPSEFAPWQTVYPTLRTRKSAPITLQ
jgi:putative transposase